MVEKMRVHILAKELNVNSKAILDKCAAEGIESVKNHMSTLSAGLEATIREWFSEGSHGTTVESAERVDLEKVRVKRRKKPAAEAAGEIAVSDGAVQVATEGEEPELETVTETAVAVEEPPAVEAEPAAPTVITPSAPPPTVEAVPSTSATDESLGKPVTEELPPSTVPSPVEPPAISVAAEAPAPVTAEIPAPQAPAVQPPEEKLAPAGPQNVPSPAKLRGPRVVRYEAPEYDVRPPPRTTRARPGEPVSVGGPPGATPSFRKAAAGDDRGRSWRDQQKGGKRGRGPEGAEGGWNNRDLIERQERLAGATGRKIHARRASESQRPNVPAGRKTEAEVEAPITMKKLTAATGLAFAQIFSVLQKQHGMMVSMNTTLEEEMAQVVCLDLGVELKVIPAKTQLDLLRDEFAARERKHLKSRPPVVTFLGHVDHGKTSLLDAIRRARVASGEEGGITQHIGSYHFKRDDLAITFLDTPGHKAFTAMRARGAQMTDIVVLVVAADDGVMPQTIEAINHAKAAGVPIVVALNKSDLPNTNLNKTYGQLSEHGLTPSGDWGGETDVIPTSATTGMGIDNLLEHLHVLADVRDLKADPMVEATGTVIEAEMREGVGAVARVLVQEGTLKEGKIVVCGPGSGKIRAILNDRGERVKTAGPSMPVEIWGLDSVPLAGDPFFEVESMQRAKGIAEEVNSHRASTSRLDTRKARSLEELLGRRANEDKTELNLIIKADVDGSLDAIRQILGELPTDQVNLTIRHAGVGAVTDGDIALADACDAIVVAFHVVPVAGAKKLAEESGVEIRQYRVIYNLVDDIKKAMEGLLAPDQREEDRATVAVREVFHISKVGMVAGCYVTQGTVVRNHMARLIRDGVIIRDSSKLTSLRRFKDDAKEVREGMECGIRLEGFDDYKPGDTIQTYEIVSVARKL